MPPAESGLNNTVWAVAYRPGKSKIFSFLNSNLKKMERKCWSPRAIVFSYTTPKLEKSLIANELTKARFTACLIHVTDRDGHQDQPITQLLFGLPMALAFLNTPTIRKFNASRSTRFFKVWHLALTMTLVFGNLKVKRFKNGH